MAAIAGTCKYIAIYIFKIDNDEHKGILKLGMTSFYSNKSVKELTNNCDELNYFCKKRIDEETKTILEKYTLLHTEIAWRKITMGDGSVQETTFTDKDVHALLKRSGFIAEIHQESGRDSEWFRMSLSDGINAISAYKEGKDTIEKTTGNATETKKYPRIDLRREQADNVEKTRNIFRKYNTMLWDCKMRYGKTITAYQLIKEEEYKRVIVVTHRPAVEDGWLSDHELMFHDTDHVFINKSDEKMDLYDAAMDYANDQKLKEFVSKEIPFVYFASMQDLRGSKRVGGKHNKNNGVFDITWDLVIIDEAHEGTQTELGQKVQDELFKEESGTKLLMLSGTPYNISGRFENNNIFTWTYVDEQRAKREWDKLHPTEKNPYAELPNMNILTFDLSESMPNNYRFVTENSAFNFREFFRTWTGDPKVDFRSMPEGAERGDFVHEEDVRSFLDLITNDSEDNNYPFSREEYRSMFKHTFWLVPGVKEAKALSKMLKTHKVFRYFSTVNIAGDGDEEKPYDQALKLVRDNIKEHEYTITISCGKLTTGVTVREWTGIMMLSGSSSVSAGGYMQAIFRVQSPGVIDGKQKENCYVFDFAPDRALKVVAKVNELSKKSKRSDEDSRIALREFLNFCPVISVEGTSMRKYSVDSMMRQIKKISVEHAINSGFDDDSIYKKDTGIVMDEFDADIIRKLSDVVYPRKKGQPPKVNVNSQGLTEEQYAQAEQKLHKPKKELTPEEKEILDMLAKQKKEQKKVFNLLRSVSIRLPLMFFGVDLDINEEIKLKDFADLVDDESWGIFMPEGLSKTLFKQILKYYDEDVLVGAGLRIRQLAKAADEFAPIERASRIIDIISHFKNPAKETVLTPWRVVNMQLSETIGGYCFFNEDFTEEIEEPRLIEQGEVTSDIFLNANAKILEMNSKSGVYPLYMAYSIYSLKLNGPEKNVSFEEAYRLWQETLQDNIFILCQTKMACSITKRTLVGYTDAKVHTLYLPKLLDRMKDPERLARKLSNPKTWGKEGERMKFDAIVGNPPYQVSDGGNKASATPIYQLFVSQAKKINPEYISMIIPAKWYSGGKGLDDFRSEMLNDKRVRKLFDFFDSNSIFPSADISGGVCFFLWNKKENDNPNCGITINRNGTQTFMERPLLEKDTDAFIRFNEAISIVRKVLEFKEDSFSYLVSARKPFGLPTNPAGLHQEKKSEDLFIYAYPENGYIAKNKITKNLDWVDSWKVLISYAYGERGDFPYFVIGKPFTGKPNSCGSETYLVIGPFANEKITYNVKTYISTKFFRFLVLLYKNTQHATKSVYKLVPIQDFSKTWTDEELYKKYNLTQDEIDYIESMIKPMPLTIDGEDWAE